MVEHVERQFGREYAVDLVRELMTRSKENGALRNQDSPIVIAEGLGGSGKTLFLTTLTAMMDQRVPYAMLDLSTSGHATVPQILSALAFELSRDCKGYGRLRFPRFILGHLVMRQTLDQHDHSVARAQVRTLMEKHRGIDTMVEILQETATDVLGAVPVLPRLPVSLVTKGVSAAADAAMSWGPGRRLLAGKPQQWFGQHGPGPAHDSIDELINLNQCARNETIDANRQRIDELMTEAFLADLRYEFAEGNVAKKALNCAILLDNVDAELPRYFLNRLITARSRYYANGRKDSDPVTFVVTSRGAVAAELSGPDRIEYTPGDLGYSGFLRRTGNRRNAWWLRCRLTDLNPDEVSAMATTMALPGNGDRIRRMVHGATGGQPVATRQLLDAMADEPGGPLDLDAVLRRPAAGHPRDSVEDQIRVRLLQGVPDEAYDDLVSCSVARDYARALQLVVQSDLLTTDHSPQIVAVGSMLWPAADGGAGTPLLRRLLQRRLAARPDGHVASWSAVHGWLSDEYRREHDDTGAMYHVLATGDVRSVARHLEPLLDKPPGTELLAILDAVTAAPSAFDHALAPIDRLSTLTRDLPTRDLPFTPLSRLVAGLWIAADPMISSRRRALHLQIAADFTTLAGFCGEGAVELLQRTQLHNQMASWWD